MAMSPDEQGIFYILIVGGGPGAGEFTYDASGNLRSANVGQVTTDPVQGITCQQGFSTFNGKGAVINLLSTSLGAFFQYQDLGTPAQGALILAVASVAGTDPVTSHTYGAGLTGIDPVFGDSIVTIGATISLILPAFTANGIVTANTGSGATSPFVSVAGPEQSHAGHAVLRIYGVSADGTVPGGVIISATDPPVRAAAALLELQGSQVLTGIATPGAPPAGDALLFADTSGFLRTLTGLAGDTNNYQVGGIAVAVASATPQTINSLGNINITGMSLPVAARRYRFKIQVYGLQGGTTANQGVGFNGPAITSMALLGTTFDVIGGILTNAVQFTAAGRMSTGNITNGRNFVATIEGEVTFSASGTLQVNGSCFTSAADTWTVQAGSVLELTPV